MSDDHHIPTAEHNLNLEPGERLVRPFTRFAKLSSSGGIVLLLMTAIAMIWANSPFKESYKEIFYETETRITVAHNPYHAPAADYGEDDGKGLDEGYTPTDTPDEAVDHGNDTAQAAGADDDGYGDEAYDSHAWSPLPNEPIWWNGHSTAMWINDLLMAIFFLVVGLEIKREVVVGELASPKRAALPIFGALGGMIGPALIFVALNLGTPTIGGWGIPMATDIAFAVGILAMLGSRVPRSLVVFLTSLAIVDDLGALAVIALFYTDHLSMTYLGYTGIVIGILVFMNILRVRWITLYLVLGLPLWYFVYMSGVHATIAGVLLAATIPAHARVNATNFAYSTRKALEIFENAHDDPDTAITQSSERRAAVNAIMKNSRYVVPPLHRIEHALHPWAAFVIIPVFALANAGIEIHGGVMENLGNSASMGVILGLFVGKPLGIGIACMIAVKLGIATLPKGISWRHIYGAGALGGIGFTMAIFIANLAYKNSPSDLEHAKLAILVASALSAFLGAGLLLSCKSKPEPEPETLGPLVNDD